MKTLAKDHGEHWLDNIALDQDVMNRIKPDLATVSLDGVARRFYVHHRRLHGNRKYFSVVERGMPQAVKLCLRQMWAWDESLTGLPCPLPAWLLSEEWQWSQTREDTT